MSENLKKVAAAVEAAVANHEGSGNPYADVMLYAARRLVVTGHQPDDVIELVERHVRHQAGRVAQHKGERH